MGSTTIEVPAGLANFSGVVSVPTDPNPVEVNVSFDSATGLLTYHLESVDPNTGRLPSDPLSGFLPVENGSGNGSGFVRFQIQPLSTVASATQINNQATITFDPTAGANPPIPTNDVLNTVDSEPPTSSVNPLPAATGSTSFTVSWGGQDANGSGIASFDVFVSDNSGPFVPFEVGTTSTSGVFTGGQDGHTYSFYCVATDNVGNVQPTPSAAQATTIVAGLPASTVQPLPATTTATTFTLSWSGAPGAARPASPRIPSSSQRTAVHSFRS